MVEAGMLAYTERFGVTRRKGVVITVGQLEFARSACTEQFLHYDFFSASPATTTPSRVYLRSLETQEDAMNTYSPFQKPTSATNFIRAQIVCTYLFLSRGVYDIVDRWRRAKDGDVCGFEVMDPVTELACVRTRHDDGVNQFPCPRQHDR